MVYKYIYTPLKYFPLHSLNICPSTCPLKSLTNLFIYAMARVSPAKRSKFSSPCRRRSRKQPSLLSLTKRQGKDQQPKCVDMVPCVIAKEDLNKQGKLEALKKAFRTKRKIIVISGARISVNGGSMSCVSSITAGNARCNWEL